MTAIRRYNWRLVKVHRSYTVGEIARLFGISKPTVRRWLKSGLPALTEIRPTLVLGADLQKFLQAKSPRRHKCNLSEAYCFKCRIPSGFIENRAIFLPVDPKGGQLTGDCDHCGTRMNKRMSFGQLVMVTPMLDITVAQADQSLMERAETCLNDHLKKV